ncbi:nitroreductase family deazaflavin-dependent oxidoreductase [Mycobacterium sp. pV006]|uniref:nitroreductase family deazaflavin-dependent oxidoreductase n=1 Tax=Mycobacterium sp. pV006 TaxID=3238983 RepID=UPI00351BBDC4
MSGRSGRNHPNHAPGVPMIFPPWFERLQIKYLNPLVRPFSKRLPGLGVIRHRGRTSGKEYETIVTPYRKGSLVAIGLAHGKTNWVKNVLAAGEADIQIGRTTLHLVRPRVLPAGTQDPSLPKMAQVVAKRSGVFVADIA